MLLRVSGVNEYKGFILSHPFENSGNVLVLTGKNGCGKTRLLESIKNSSTLVTIDEIELTNEDIILVGHQSLTPNYGGMYHDALFQEKITSTLQKFDRVKADLDSPIDLYKAREVDSSTSRGPSMMRGQSSREDSLPYESLYHLCQSIAKRLNKKPSLLTHDEIELYYRDNINNVLGFQEISSICNQYIKRKALNEFNEWRSKEKSKNLKYLADNNFIQEFGIEPWIIINQIIKETFDGKFYFNSPNTTSQSYSYQASLMQHENNQVLDVDALSSGEKTLLWLALTLFNSQYYDQEAIKPLKLLLIDEPDAFLHPQMVIKMYRTLEAFSKNFNSKILITTHSPTTIALAPEDSTYIVGSGEVTLVSKDKAIAELLDGVTQISINPENRRQVFVESQYDVNVYQNIYSHLRHRSEVIDPMISLNFVSSGPKMPQQLINDKVKQIFKINDDQLIDKFVTAINGVGNCTQVIAQVEALAQNDHETVRGIIDFDQANTSTPHIAVLAQDHAYSIENIALDPICILLLLHTTHPESYRMLDICGEDVYWGDWLNNQELMQVSVDRFINHILSKENDQTKELTYVSGITLLTDSEYLSRNGHDIESLVKGKYPQLNQFARSGKNGELKDKIAKRAMINLTNGKLIPKAFELVLSQVQTPLIKP